jgi:transposase
MILRVTTGSSLPLRALRFSSDYQVHVSKFCLLFLISFGRKEAFIEFFHSQHSILSINKKLHISDSVVETWIHFYQNKGLSGFNKLPYKLFCSEFKELVMRAVLNNCLSFQEVALKFQISPFKAYRWPQLVK